MVLLRLCGRSVNVAIMFLFSILLVACGSGSDGTGSGSSTNVSNSVSSETSATVTAQRSSKNKSTLAAGDKVYVFVTDPATKIIYTYSSNNGTLSESPVSQISTGFKSLNQIAVSPDSKHLYAINAGDGNVTSYAIDLNTGTLSATGSIHIGTLINDVDQREWLMLLATLECERWGRGVKIFPN